MEDQLKRRAVDTNATASQRRQKDFRISADSGNHLGFLSARNDGKS